MNLESIDLHSVEKELRTRIEKLEYASKAIQNHDQLQVFNELFSLVKSLYDTIIQIKGTRIRQDNFFSTYNYNFLSLTGVSPKFTNNIQLLSKKLHIPINVIINALMTEISLNTNLSKSEKLLTEINYSGIRKGLLKDKYEITLSNKDYLEVVKSDLDEFDIRYNFRDIEILIFKDISVQQFQDHVGTISNCQVLFIPDFIPKLVIYGKVRYVDTIQIYKSLDDVYDAVFILDKN